MIGKHYQRIQTRQELESWLKFSSIKLIEAPSCMKETYACDDVHAALLFDLGFHSTGLAFVLELYGIKVVLVKNINIAEKIRETFITTGLNLWLENQDFHRQCDIFQRFANINIPNLNPCVDYVGVNHWGTDLGTDWWRFPHE